MEQLHSVRAWLCPGVIFYIKDKHENIYGEVKISLNIWSKNNAECTKPIS